jgi:hypothetical protein
LLTASGSCAGSRLSDAKLLEVSVVFNSGASWLGFCSEFSKISQFVFASVLLITASLSPSILLSDGVSKNIPERLRLFSVVSAVSHWLGLLFRTTSVFVLSELFIVGLVLWFKSVMVLIINN